MTVSKLNLKTVESLIKMGKRIDGRGLFEYRPINVEQDYVFKAEGSALVSLGKTKVLVGVKLGLGTPFSDNPDEGVLMTVAELTPMASPHFEAGPPTPFSIELARVVDRAIRESKMIELDKLFIEEDKVWMVNVDFYPLDMDGNLFDAALLGATTALRTAKMPKYEDGKIIFEERKKALPVRDKPVSCTFAKVGEKIVLDPNELEEQIMSARLTIGMNQKDHICSMQKGGFSGFSEEELNQAVAETVKQAKKLRKLIP